MVRKRIKSYLKVLFSDSRTVGTFMFLFTILSLAIANSQFSESYHSFFHYPISASKNWHLPSTLLDWINDGFMCIFFFSVGLEIKREFIQGELSTLKKAITPVIAALGGIVFPAFIFILLNLKNINYQNGWGIPMATDIVFSLAIFSLLGSRISHSLKIFLMALAIIDDIGAVITIALFYTKQISWVYLGIAFMFILLLYFLTQFKKIWIVELLIAVCLWYCIHCSGIHATVAGLLYAFCIPIARIEILEHKLHIPVQFIIVPLFILANTGVVFPHNLATACNNTLFWGIVLGLFIGKPLGIFVSTYIAQRLHIAQLPFLITWKELVGLGIVAGIGFTMSIFVTSLAFSNVDLQQTSKIAILFSSLLASITGYLYLLFFCKKTNR